MKSLLIITLALILSGCSSLSPFQTSDSYWRYDIATNADELFHTSTFFYSKGEMIYRDPGSGTIQGVTRQSLADKNYRWFIAGGLSMGQLPVPDKASISWFSYYDRTSYQITLSLPKNLSSLMCKELFNSCSNALVFGIAPGGYVQLWLRRESSSDTILLVEGMADPLIKGNALDVTDPQLTYSLNLFERTFIDAYRKNPIPYGPDWKAVMDSYAYPFTN